MKKEKRIRDVVKSIGLLTEKQLKQALEEQHRTRERFSDILKRLGFISGENLNDVIASHSGIVPEVMANLKIPQEVISILPPLIAIKHRLVPTKLEGDLLTLATDDILNLLVIENLGEQLKRQIDIVISSKAELDHCLEHYYGLKEEAIDNVVESLEVSDAEAKSAAREAESTPHEEEEAPIIKLVSLLIMEAVRARASDIHAEPLEGKFRIRYRIDGVLHEVPGPPKRLQGSVISRIKLMAGMNLAEKRLPQDGRIRFALQGKELDLRVSTLPAVYGESVVMRLLDKSNFALGLKELGFLEDDEERFKALIKLPHGILLDTGPTGSGKTTTLYASLNYINKPDRKLITVEEPVEYQLSGVNQVQVRPQIGLTFAKGLRSILRQAPDVIMVGEIRDNETAQIAIQAALTGHLVFSTLHTNDAPGAVTRLIDMGIKTYMIASSLQAALAQRLVRLICPHCKKEYKPSQEEIMVLESANLASKSNGLRMGEGCERCSFTGFLGRISIFEILVMNDNLRELILKNVPTNELRKEACKAGMRSLREDGLIKATRGLTSIQEVLRVTQEESM
ncbi:MAG: type II/IV secretion system protein [Candidatus Omnitrophica bacterium]|nr:type II/IV secretion system protein [Candidatus Omnitrophota bacterium]